MSERNYSSLNDLQIAENALLRGARESVGEENGEYLSTDDTLLWLSKGVREIIKRQSELISSPLESAIDTHRQIATLYDYATLIIYGRDEALGAKLMEGVIKHRFECVTLQARLAETKLK